MTVVCVLVWLSPPLYAKASVSCNSGLEFDCKAVQGNGESCVLGCNLTVTRTLSPGKDEIFYFYCTFETTATSEPLLYPLTSNCQIYKRQSK